MIVYYLRKQNRYFGEKFFGGSCKRLYPEKVSWFTEIEEGTIVLNVHNVITAENDPSCNTDQGV